jgi:MFS family permease
MLRHSLPARPEARRFLVGTLFSAVGRGLTLPFLLIYLTEVRDLTAGRAGLVVGWYGAVVLLLAPFGGTLIDRFGSRRIVVTFLLVEAAGTGSLAVVHSFGSALLAASVIAVGSSGVWAGQATLLSSLTGEGERQRVFGLEFTLLNLGIGIGGLIAGAVVDTTRPVTFQAIYLLDALTFLVPALIVLSMPAIGHPPPRAAVPGERSRAGGGYLTVLRDRPFRRLVLFALAITTCGYAQLEVGFTAYSVQVAEVTPRVVAWALASNAMIIVVCQLVVIRRLEGRSRSGALAAVGAVFAVSWLVLGLGGLVGRGNALLAAGCVVACASIFALGETMLSPVLPAITNTLATDELRGRYNAMNSMSTGISGVIGPVTAGPLIGAGNGAVWVLLVVGGCLVASTVALSLRRLLTPAQDGRAGPVVAPPVTASTAGR